MFQKPKFNKMKKTIFFLLLAVIILTSCEPKQKGSVKGELCYPSDYIPSLKVILKNKESGKTFTLITNDDDKTFEIKNIPIGHYVAYAYKTEDKTRDYGGGFTEAVPCSLTIDCKDHSLIEFEVKPNETKDGIRICDWYGAILPKDN